MKKMIVAYRKIPKISPGVYIFKGPFWGANFWRGLSTEGYLRFKIDWASPTVGSKCTVLALFYFVFEGNFPSTSPRGAYIWRGDLTECLRYRFGGLIFGGAYTWRGLFSEFYGMYIGERGDGQYITKLAVYDICRLQILSHLRKWESSLGRRLIFPVKSLLYLFHCQGAVGCRSSPSHIDLYH